MTEFEQTILELLADRGTHDRQALCNDGAATWHAYTELRRNGYVHPNGQPTEKGNAYLEGLDA